MGDVMGNLRGTVLHAPGRDDTHWSTANVGEAVPGVTTPLCWSVWETACDSGLREMSYQLGIFNRQERAGPHPGEDPIVSCFYGRIAMSMDWLGCVGDRMPGTTGPQTIETVLGHVPSTMTFAPTIRRYPVVAGRLPVTGIRTTRAIRALAPGVHEWWSRETTALASADETTAIEVFRAALPRFRHVLRVHAVGLFGVISPLVQTVQKLVERAGVGDVGALSGTGGAEMKLIEDLWAASRGDLSALEVARRQGYHGLRAGELSSRVWREDPTALEHIIATYRGRPETDSPMLRQVEATANLPRLQREVLDALPRAARPPAQAALKLAASTIPLRGVGKASFLQGFDVLRAAARRRGEHLTEAGVLDTPDDVFFLTVDELLTPTSQTDLGALVVQRRELRAAYEAFNIPSVWRGTPVPVETAAEPGAATTTPISGIGASVGVVEGVVRVVTDPTCADIDDGAVLVCTTTDPSWASIMYVSAALVVDVGSMMSHAAVVAREIGLPCVVNTINGTTRLRDGDRVRVDGKRGVVEILDR